MNGAKPCQCGEPDLTVSRRQVPATATGAGCGSGYGWSYQVTCRACRSMASSTHSYEHALSVLRHGRHPPDLEQALAEIHRLEALINSPIVDDWLQGVRLEAVHQVERWGTDGDAGKTDPDWFWLVGFLAGKALFSVMQGNVEKAKHHTISTGGALLNWWRHIKGDATRMRPGIEPAKEKA